MVFMGDPGDAGSCTLTDGTKLNATLIILSL